VKGDKLCFVLTVHVHKLIFKHWRSAFFHWWVIVE